MIEADARQVLLIRAIESEDAAEAVLTREDRQQATAAGLRADDGGKRADARFLAHRAAFAVARLTTRFPAVGRVLRATVWPRWLNWLIPLGALVLGLVTNEIDSGKRLNIIGFPLLGMLVWNLTIYALIVLAFVRSLLRRGRLPARPPWLARLAGVVSGLTRQHPDRGQPLGRGLPRFVREWAAAAAALTYARATRTLHLAAAALAGGVVLGMYLRALGIEYRAGWESTFIGAGTLHAMLSLVLGPASAVTGLALPDADYLAALRWTPLGGGENAGRWIHLYATTAALFIVGPRLVLAGWSAALALRLRRMVAVPGRDDFYVRRLLRGARGAGTDVRVIPYAFTPTEPGRQTLTKLLSATFGDDTRTTFEAAIRYGAEDEWLAATGTGADDDYVLVLCNLASTPEEENHGALVAGVIAAVAGRGGDGSRVAVLLDASGYRQRLAGQAGADARLESRRIAWQRMLAPQGVVPLVLTLDEGVTPAMVRRLEGALMTSATLGAEA